MNNKDKAAIFDYIVEILKQRGEPPEKTDALIQYLKDTSINETSDRLLFRVSQIFNKDISSMYAGHAASQIEVMNHRIMSLEQKMLQIENRNSEPVQWHVIQAIAWVITFAASLIAIYLAVKP